MRSNDNYKNNLKNKKIINIKLYIMYKKAIKNINIFESYILNVV